MISFLSLRRANLLFAAAAGAALGFALISQYGFGLVPCHLCILQRWPYGVVMALGVAVWCAPQKFQWWILVLIAVALMVDAGIAFYHSGVELHWFPGPDSCTSNTTGKETIEEIYRQIMEAPLVSCDQPMVQFLGLSMAAWNGLYAGVAAIFAAVILWRRRSER